MEFFYNGIFEVCKVTKDKTLLNAIIKMDETNQWKPGPSFKFPNYHKIMQTYIDLFDLQRDSQMIKPSVQFSNALCNAKRTII